jgi:uncharacterized spore protein YtfJ
MNTKLNEMMTDIATFLKNEANTKTVVGETFKLGNFDCVPVIRVGMGFGSGTGERDLPRKEHDEGIGAGVGMGIEPIGFLVTNMETIQFIPTKSSPGIAKIFEAAPNLIEKYFEGKRKEAEVAAN